MPTYEFRCPNGHGFERFYKTMSTAVAELPCPECNATAARQLSAGAGLVFKGSGFYLTDYGKNAHRGTEKAGKSEGKSEGGSKSDGGGKSEGGGKPEGGSKAEGGKSDGGKSESSSKSDSGSSKNSSDAKPAPKSDSAKSSSRPKSE